MLTANFWSSVFIDLFSPNVSLNFDAVSGIPEVFVRLLVILLQASVWVRCVNQTQTFCCNRATFKILKTFNKIFSQIVYSIIRNPLYFAKYRSNVVFCVLPAYRSCLPTIYYITLCCILDILPTCIWLADLQCVKKFTPPRFKRWMLPS